jgi:hypothetical protein
MGARGGAERRDTSVASESSAGKKARSAVLSRELVPSAAQKCRFVPSFLPIRRDY